MGANSGFFIGLGVATVVGGLGAGGAHVLAARVIIPEPQVMTGLPEVPRIDVHEVAGDVRMFAPDGTERGVRDGDRLARPTGVVTSGFESAVTVGYRDARFRVSHDARVMFNAPGHRLAVYAERGHVLVHRKPAIATTVSGHGLSVAGSSYGIWVRPDRASLVTLSPVKVTRGDETKEYGGGQLVTFRAGGATTSKLETQLRLIVDKVIKTRKGFSVEGHTSPGAEVMVKRDGTLVAVAVDAEGNFKARIAGEAPEPGELVAFDGAGRHAEIGAPSVTLEELATSVDAEYAPTSEGAAPAPATPQADETKGAAEPMKADTEAAGDEAPKAAEDKATAEEPANDDKKKKKKKADKKAKADEKDAPAKKAKADDKDAPAKKAKADDKAKKSDDKAKAKKAGTVTKEVGGDAKPAAAGKSKPAKKAEKTSKKKAEKAGKKKAGKKKADDGDDETIELDWE